MTGLKTMNEAMLCKYITKCFVKKKIMLPFFQTGIPAAFFFHFHIFLPSVWSQPTLVHHLVKLYWPLHLVHLSTWYQCCRWFPFYFLQPVCRFWPSQLQLQGLFPVLFCFWCFSVNPRHSCCSVKIRLDFQTSSDLKYSKSSPSGTKIHFHVQILLKVPSSHFQHPSVRGCTAIG